MVLMLCLGTAAKADLVGGYSFADGSLSDCSGNGNNGTVYEGTPGFSSSAPSAGSSGGMSLDLNGASSVEIPLDPVMFDGTSPYSIVAWFRTTSSTEPASVMVSCSSPTGSEATAEEDTPWGVMVFEGDDGYIANYDQFYNQGEGSETDGVNDGQWYHFAVVYDGSGAFTTYLDGVQDGADGSEIWENPPAYDPDHSVTDTVICIGNMVDPYWALDFETDGHFDGQLKDIGIYDHALGAGEVATAMDEGYQCYGPKNPIAVDPNIMLVYETNTTQGDFDVSLKFRPVGQGFGAPGPNNLGDPYTLTVLIDPNGGTGLNGNGGYSEGTPGEKDIVLRDGAGAENQITLTFTPTTSDGGPCGDYVAISGGVGQSCWDYPVTIIFNPIDDPCAEPPSLFEATDIGITIISTVVEPNLNGPLDSEQDPWEAGDPKWSKTASATVKDNDQATILSVKEDGESEQIDPYKLLETPLSFGSGWGGAPDYLTQTVRITLQVEPKNDADPCAPLDAYVRVEMTKEAEDNPPSADPCLVPDSTNTPSEPNAIVFTVDGAPVVGVIGDAHKWDVPYLIVIQANNDDELQAEPGEDEGSENYGAELLFFVESTTDKRYGESVQQYDDQDDPIPGFFEWEALETGVPINIQDDECGAFGLLSLDVSNPYWVTDPNWLDEDGFPLPDCYVNIYDVLEMAIPFAALNASAEDQLQFALKILQGGDTIERWPEVGFVSLMVPAADYEARHWMV